MALNKKGKIIKDPVHGFMDLNRMQVELLSQPEVQRMTWIKQLGLGLLVYPGGHHTRLEHCIGTSYLCSRIAKNLEIDVQEKKLLEAAGMLHDIGHPPFSHTIEEIMEKNHVEATKNLILGKENIGDPNSGNIPEVLRSYDLDPRDVADLVTGSFRGNKYLGDIIDSQMDADQLDYLARDAHHTGVSYGSIETDWIINVMGIDGGRLTYREKGIDALEDCIIARDHMYSSVYSHKTSSIAEKMLLRAVERYLETQDNMDKNIFWMTDGELMNTLSGSNAFSKSMVERIKMRNLYKQVYNINNTNEEELKRYRCISEKDEKDIEREITELCDLNPDTVIVNKRKDLISEFEPRLRKFDIRISFPDGRISPLEEISTTVKSLKKKDPVGSLLSIYAAPEKRDEVGEVAEEYIKSS